MRLYSAVNSPYARKCRVVLAERGITHCEVVQVVPMDNPPELIVANPLAKVPALVMDNGTVLCDSTVIVDYLDSLGERPRLIPQEATSRVEVLALAALADGLMDLAVEWIIQTRQPTELQWPHWIERRRQGILRTAKVIAGNPLLMHAPLSLAQINVACALAYVDFRFPSLDWRSENTDLAEFVDHFSTRASMQATAPIA